MTTRMAEIESQTKSIDSELSTMNELLSKAEMEIVNLAETWRKAGVIEKQELQLTHVNG